VADAETFAVSLRAFAQRAPVAVSQVVRKVSLQLLTSTVMRTPVGNPDVWAVKRAPKGYVGGRLRANWNVSLGAIDTSTADTIDQDGGATIDRGSLAMEKADGTQDLFIANSLPYAIPIEYGHSGVQAPQGMVRVTVAEFQEYIARAAQQVTE